jgi:diaminohydroxyphosphoribosylaminopyrimidine deaminase / 5-amino-6-(5-phosphoribosylamino)uracil reductase
MENNNYMRIALDLAYSQIGVTTPNPSVGAVIVKNNNIISTGITAPAGGDHAEVNAIKNCIKNRIDLTGADIYVTLEPCSHYGKTPPCVDIIIKNKFNKVITPIKDPNPIVAGNGIKKLRDSGISVDLDLQNANKAKDLIRPFEKYILQKRPYVINKSALTLDGKTAAPNGDSKWITSSLSRLLVHRIREKVDAIVIGKNTFINDNPTLNVRPGSFKDEDRLFFEEKKYFLYGYDNFFIESILKNNIFKNNNPKRIVIGIPENIDLNKNIFYDDNYLFFASDDDLNKILLNKDRKNIIKNINIIKMDKLTIQETPHFILRELYKMGIISIMLEGGSILNGTFFNEKLIDQIIYFIAPKIAGDGLSPIKGDAPDEMSNLTHLNDFTTVMIKDNIMVNGYI